MKKSRKNSNSRSTRFFIRLSDYTKVYLPFNKRKTQFFPLYDDVMREPVEDSDSLKELEALLFN